MGSPSNGVFTGVAAPTNSVNVFAKALLIQRLPLASTPAPNGPFRPASSPNPAAGDTGCSVAPVNWLMVLP